VVRCISGREGGNDFDNNYKTNMTRMSHYKDKDNNHATQQTRNAQRSHVILVCVVKHGGRGVGGEGHGGRNMDVEGGNVLAPYPRKGEEYGFLA
jgi:hypothetical protein